MSFGLLGSDVAYYAAVCDIYVLGYLVLLNEEKCVGALDISYSLEKVSYLICKFPCPFWLVGPLHEVPVLFRFFGLWAYLLRSSGPDGLSCILLSCWCVPSFLLFFGLIMRGLICGVDLAVGLLLRGWPLDCGLASLLPWYCICVPLGC